MLQQILLKTTSLLTKGATYIVSRTEPETDIEGFQDSPAKPGGVSGVPKPAETSAVNASRNSSAIAGTGDSNQAAFGHIRAIGEYIIDMCMNRYV